MTSNSKSHYRPDIDGLRAIAITLVIFYHAFPKLIPGGFIGVDVFFVISGYLITGTILKNLENASFSFLDFYGRRFRRIIPALVLVLLASVGLGYFGFRQLRFEKLGEHLEAAATFTSNLLLYKESGYFDASADTKPFLHLWSLSVEEQFYIFWPAALMFCFRFKKYFFRILLLIFAASLSASLIRIHRAPQAAFYALPYRFWELLAGGLLSGIELKHSLGWIRKFSTPLNFLSLCLIAIPTFLLGPQSLFPGMWAILPVAASFIIIAAGPDSWLNKNILSHPSAVWIGLISYPLYLWHWPLLVYTRVAPETLPAFLDQPLVVLALSTLLAYLSYKLFEKPIQRFFAFRKSEKTPFIRTPWAAIGATAVLLLAFAFAGNEMQQGKWTTLDHQRFPNALVLEEYPVQDISRVRPGKCFLDSSHVYAGFAPECTQLNDAQARVMVVLGDSLSAHFYPGLKAIYSNEPLNLVQMTASSCLPFLVAWPTETENCKKVREDVLSYLKKTKPDVVFLHGLWDAAERKPWFYPSLEATLKTLRDVGIQKIIVMGPTPVWLSPLPEILENNYLRKNLAIPKRLLLGLTPTFFDSDKRIQDFISRDPNVIGISTLTALCDSSGGCLTQVGDDLQTDLTVYDTDHFTLNGAEYLAKNLNALKFENLFGKTPRAKHD
jgi:peptidoglycan/LPS O-acetylase OafA/YrhL